MEFYNSDDTALEAVIRSNPGLVILKMLMFWENGILMIS